MANFLFYFWKTKSVYNILANPHALSPFFTSAFNGHGRTFSDILGIN